MIREWSYVPLFSQGSQVLGLRVPSGSNLARKGEEFGQGKKKKKKASSYVSLRGCCGVEQPTQILGQVSLGHLYQELNDLGQPDILSE